MKYAMSSEEIEKVSPKKKWIELTKKGIPNWLETASIYVLVQSMMKYSASETVSVTLVFASVRSLLKLCFKVCQFYKTLPPKHSNDKTKEDGKILTPNTPLIPTTLGKSMMDAPKTLAPDTTKMEPDKSMVDAPKTLTPDTTKMESDKSMVDAPKTLTPDTTKMESDKSIVDAPKTLAPDTTKMESDKSMMDAPKTLTPDQSTNTDFDKNHKNEGLKPVSVYTDVQGDLYEFTFTCMVQVTLYAYLLEWVSNQDPFDHLWDFTEQRKFFDAGCLIGVVIRRFTETFHKGEFECFWTKWYEARLDELRNLSWSEWVKEMSGEIVRFASSWVVNDVLALTAIFLFPVILSKSDNQMEFVKDATAVMFIAEMDNLKKDSYKPIVLRRRDTE